MNIRIGRLGLAGLLLLAFPLAGHAYYDNFASGFFTRGAEAADYIDLPSDTAAPFYVPAKNWVMLPRVTLLATYEDNVFLEPEDGQKGWSLGIVPGVMALWGRRSDNHLFADYGINIPLYESYYEMADRPSHMLRLGSVYRTGRGQVFTQLGFRRLEEADQAVGARTARTDLFGDIALEHRLTGKSSAGLVGRAERHDYKDDRYVDYDRFYAGGRYFRRATDKLDAFVQAGIGRDEPRNTDSDASAADFYDVALGLRGKRSQKFNMGGRLGYMWRRYDLETRSDYDNWTASLQAESNPFGLTTFTGELYGNIQPAPDIEGFDFYDRGATLGVNRRLFVDRVRGNASVTAGRVDYVGVPAAAGDGESRRTVDGRRDDYWGFTLGLDWWPRPRYSIGLAYSYMERDGSKGADEETQRATSYEYGRWSLRASWNY